MGRPRIHPKVERTERLCACGCGQTFSPFPVYKNGTIYVAEYMRGHHPGPSKTQFGKVPTWNKGKKKGDHPSIDRMGFQPGHEPFGDWSHVNDAIRNNPEVRAKWLASKKGQIAWNKGLTGIDDPRVPMKGNHWNWQGNPNGVRETHEYTMLRKFVFERDEYTCRECGDTNGQGRGVSVKLHMHHVVPVCHDRERVLDPTNVVTLCETCHRKTDTYGPGALRKLRLSCERQ